MRKEHPSNDVSITFQCPHCEFTSKYKAGMSRHVYCKHTSFDEVNWLECEQCPYKAKSEVFLKVHVINKHTTPEE
ncbi:unnamed protein product, partial [Tenebrio molitor]